MLISKLLWSRLARLVLFTLCTAACAAQPADDSGPDFTIGVESRRLDLNPLRSFIAFEAQINTALYEGLVGYHPRTLRPMPAVAERWEISPDRRTYRFFIRRDARYSNGDRVLAAHFRDSWLQVLDPAGEAPYSFLFDIIAGARAYRLGTATIGDFGVSVEDGNILVIRLDEPAPHLLGILAHHSAAPLHPLMLDFDRWEPSELISNGPYTIVEQSPQRIIMHRNPYYWDRAQVEVGRLQVEFYDDPDAATDAYNIGAIDWIASGVTVEDIQDRNSIIINALFATTYFYFVSDIEPWSIPEVRRALGLLLPWDSIRDSEIYLNPAHTLVPPIPEYPAIEGIQQQQSAAALQLLEQAGFPNGRGLPQMRLLIPAVDTIRDIATLMVDSWQESIELSVVIDEVAYPEYFDALNGTYTLAMISWIGDFADPLTFLQIWTTDNNLNDSGFSDSAYDGLIQRSMVEEGVTRYNTLGEAERIILDSGLVLPINHSPAFNIIDLERFDGWFPNTLDIHPFKYLRIREHAPIPDVAHTMNSDYSSVPAGYQSPVPVLPRRAARRPIHPNSFSR